MLNRLFLLLILFTMLFGCSSQASKHADINEDLYNDSVEVVNLYTDYVENGKGSFNEISRKWVFYTNKYSNQDNMTETEQKLLLRMALMSLRVNEYDIAFASGDLDKTKDKMNRFEEYKNEINDILNLK